MMDREGVLFVGDDGVILAGFHGQNPRLFKPGSDGALWRESGMAERARPGRGAALDLGLDACRGGEASIVIAELPTPNRNGLPLAEADVSSAGVVE